MSQPLIDIMNLNLPRYGSTFDLETFNKTLDEELDELQKAIAVTNIHEIIDAANDAIVVLAGLITKFGYNPHLTLKQTVREISSRQQNPKQAFHWKSNPDLVGKTKWQKDINQDPSTLYKADYNTCKLHSKG